MTGGTRAIRAIGVSIYAPYETDFVLVQWDERGARQTFAKAGRPPPVEAYFDKVIGALRQILH